MDQADDRTEYSAATSLSDSKRGGLILQLADQLIDEGLFDGLDEQSIETVYSVVQDLIRTFALKIGFNAQSQIQRDIMYYSHKFSRSIAQLFEMRWRDGNRDLTSLDARISPETAQEMTRDWLNSLDNQGEFEYYGIPDTSGMEEDQLLEENIQDDHPDQDYEQDEEVNTSNLSAYRELISESPAYDWLLASLRRESLIEVGCSLSMEDIKKELMDSLRLSHKISKSRPAEVFRVTILVNWNPITFLEEQQYQGSLDEAIEQVITLTGSTRNAQASTTLQYLRQTWPTTGEHVLQLVKDVLGGLAGQKYICTELTAWIDNAEFATEVSGTGASIVEIGQQLAWLSASLRSSPYETGITFYTPSVHVIHSGDRRLQVPNPNVHCQIEFTIEKGQDISSDNGQCWHNMFRNPIVVQGFTVLRRPKVDTGIEMPLNMMSALANTQRIDEFDDKIFIKGFSTILIPTEYIGGVIIWHLQYRDDGNRISYFDACVPHISIQTSDLEQSRNIVGWCSQADLFAGAAEANYTVQRSGLPEPTADCVLHKISISAGKHITGGIDFAMGIKDQPIYIARGGYTNKLEWIHERFIVLWDEKYKRGWLVNGTTALLHLSRAALNRKQEGSFKHKLLFKPGSLEEATKGFTSESAIRVLTNESNMKLKIHQDPSQHNEIVLRGGTDKEEIIHEERRNFYRFQDLVDDHYNILDKMIDHQLKATNKDGVSLKCWTRRHHLDGWDFDDIVKIRNCHPRAATLGNMGYGWVNLVTKIGAVILHGQNFGNIIQPSSTKMLCNRWSQMPENKYYLGACVSDLVNITQSHGEKGAEQLRFINDISWHFNTDNPFESCRCNNSAPANHSDFIQKLQKSDNLKEPPSNISSETLELQGAHDTGICEKAKPPVTLTFNSEQITPMLDSTTSGQGISSSGLHESQTEAGIDDSLATSISNAQRHTTSRSQDSSKILGGTLPDNHASTIQDTVASASQEKDGLDPRQKNGRRGRWKHFKQRFFNLFRKWDKN
ncbi:hypothetical protein GGI43DRAFT_430478 [Trichoderma evansii]